ncbi:hypothetical protein [Vibrio sp. WXL103]
MKKQWVLLPLLIASTSVLAKVTYEDAVASAQVYQDTLDAARVPTHTEGLPPNWSSSSGSNNMGIWYLTGSTTNTSTAMNSRIMLRKNNSYNYSGPSTLNEACIVGLLGYIHNDPINSSDRYYQYECK